MSNNDPSYIAYYFLNCVQSLEGASQMKSTHDVISIGCPMVLRTDLGTENTNIAFLQCILRHQHSDSLSGSNSHWYGNLLLIK